MSLIEHAAREQIENLHRENVRFNIIGLDGISLPMLISFYRRKKRLKNLSRQLE